LNKIIDVLAGNYVQNTMATSAMNNLAMIVVLLHFVSPNARMTEEGFVEKLQRLAREQEVARKQVW
jgi:hypothetical protein